MFKKLFFVFLVSVFTSVSAYSKFTDFVIKNSNGEEVDFAKFENECSLVVNSDPFSEVAFTNRNMEYLKSLKLRYPFLNVIVIPQSKFQDEAENNENTKTFVRHYGVEDLFELMNPMATKISESEIFNFLNQNSNDPRGQITAFTKFFINKDNTIRKFNPDHTGNFLGILPTDDLEKRIKSCGRVTHLSEYKGRDIDGNHVSFQNYENRCVLVVNTASNSDRARFNMEFLNELTNSIPQLEIVAFPSDSFDNEKKTDEEVKKWFEEWNVSYQVMDKINVHNDELFNFLNRQSKNQKTESDFVKYVVEKDGLTVTTDIKDLKTYLKRCSGSQNGAEQEVKFTDLSSKSVNNEEVSFSKYKDECVLVVNTDYSLLHNDIKKNMNRLASLKQSHPLLKIVLIPQKRYSNEPENNENTKLFYQQWLTYKLSQQFDIMAPMDKNVEDNEVMKFLIKKTDGHKAGPAFTKYLVYKDASNVVKYGPEQMTNTNDLDRRISRCLKLDSFLEYKGLDLDNNVVSFRKYEDKCVLVLTTASASKVSQIHMGYLSNLLVRLGEKHSDLNDKLKVVAFPSNSFDNEPRSINGLKKWFFEEWKVPFDVYAPINVEQSRMYRYLLEKTGTTTLNLRDFTKFVVFKNGSPRIEQNYNLEHLLNSCLSS